MTIAEFINKVGFKVDEKDVEKVNGTISDIKSTATKLLGAIGIGFSLTQMNELVEEFGRVNNQIRNSTEALGDQQEIQEQILASASKTRSSFADTAKVVSNLVKENKTLFGNVEEAAKFNNAATMLFKTAGKTNEEIAGLMEAINKSFAKGKVDTETINQLLERSPEAIELLNRKLGTTSDQLEQMVSDGKISVKDLKDVFVENADEIEKNFQNVPMTVTDALLDIRNKWGFWLSDMDETLGVTKTLSKIMVAGFDKIMAVLNKVRDGFKWLSDEIGGTENLLKLATITAGAFAAVFYFPKAIKGLKNLGKAIGKINVKMLAIVAVVVLIALLIDDLINFIQGNNSVIGSLFDKAGIDSTKFREGLSNLWKTVKDFIPVVKEFALGIGKELLGSLKTLLPVLMNLGKQILPVLMNLIKRVVSFLTGTGKSILTFIINAVVKLLPLLIEIIVAVLPVIINLIAQALPLLIQIIDAVLPIIIDLINQLLPIILEIIDNVLPIIVELIEMLVPVLVEIVEAIMPVLLELISTIFPMLQPIIELVANLVSDLMPVLVSLLDSIIPILEPILALLQPIADIIGVIVTAIGKVVGWAANGLGDIIGLFFGGGGDSETAKKVNAYADGTESTSDTFIAGEEGPELITGAPGKKVFTALETGNIFKAMELLARTAVAQPATVTNSSNSRVVNQYNEFVNTFNGEPALQKNAEKTIHKATGDATAELARGLAFAR